MVIGVETAMQFASFKSGDGQPVPGTGKHGKDGRRGGKHKDEHGHGKGNK